MSAGVFLLVAFVGAIMAAAIASLLAAVLSAAAAVIAGWGAGTFIAALGLAMTAYNFLR